MSDHEIIGRRTIDDPIEEATIQRDFLKATLKAVQEHLDSLLEDADPQPQRGDLRLGDVVAVLDFTTRSWYAAGWNAWRAGKKAADRGDGWSGDAAIWWLRGYDDAQRAHIRIFSAWESRQGS